MTPNLGCFSSDLRDVTSPFIIEKAREFFKGSGNASYRCLLNCASILGAGIGDRQALRLSREDFDAGIKRLISSVARDMPAITWTKVPLKTLAAFAVVLLFFGVLTYIKFVHWLLSHKSSTGIVSSSVEGFNVSGKWGTPLIQNIYSPDERSTIVFEFTQSGDAVLGSVTEMADDAKTVSTKRIVDREDTRQCAFVLYERGRTWESGNTISYKETYRVEPRAPYRP